MHFFWPWTEVVELCKSCKECQKAAGHKKISSSIKSITCNKQTFCQRGIDLLGPLPRTKAGHQFILTMVAYATRHPLALPLKQKDSVSIAGKLMTIFCHVGMPKETLSECCAILIGHYSRTLPPLRDQV